MWDRLEASNVEIREHTGADYDPGMALDVLLFQDDPSLKHETIIETIKPSIFVSGRLVSPGEVIVGKPSSPEETFMEGEREVSEPEAEALLEEAEKAAEALLEEAEKAADFQYPDRIQDLLESDSNKLPQHTPNAMQPKMAWTREAQVEYDTILGVTYPHGELAARWGILFAERVAAARGHDRVWKSDVNAYVVAGIVAKETSDFMKQDLNRQGRLTDAKFLEVSESLTEEPVGEPIEVLGGEPVGELDPESQNTVFTPELVNQARENLKKKLGSTMMGLDPTVLADLIIIGGGHIEPLVKRGVANFSSWAQRTMDEYKDILLEAVQDAIERRKTEPPGATVKTTKEYAADVEERLKAAREELPTVWSGLPVSYTHLTLPTIYSV